MSKNRTDCTTPACIDNEREARILKDLMRYTLVLAALAFGSGLGLGRSILPSGALLPLLLSASGCVLLCPVLPRRIRRTLLLIGTLLLGCVRGLPDSAFPPWLILRAQSLTAVTGEVISYPSVGWGRVSFTLRPDELPGDLRVTWEAVEGAACRRIRFGDRVIARGAVRLPEPFEGFDYPSYLERQGVFATMYAEGAEAVSASPGESISLLAAGDGLRQRLILRLREHLGEDEASLAQGLLLGDRSAMSEEIEDRFGETGLMHLLAVSGLHLGILLAGAWFGLRKSGLRPVAAYPIVGLLVLAFLWVVGPRVSLIRASLMFAFLGLGSVLADVGLILRRSIDPLNGLAAAGLTILALMPGQLFESGFQLSFAATAGILVAFQPWMRVHWEGWTQRWVRRLPEILRRPALSAVSLTVVSLAAQASAAPVVAWHFGTLHLFLVLTNLLVIPLVTIALWAGLLGLTLGASAFSLQPFEWMLTALAWSVGALAQIPGASLAVSQWFGLWLGGLVGLAVLVAYVSSSSRTSYSTSMMSSSVDVR